MPPRPSVDENEIEEAFLKGSGPGGQKIVRVLIPCPPVEAALTSSQNKTSSAVQLKHLPTGLVVKSQETRSRSQNRKIARRILAEKLEQIQLGDQSRTAIKAQEAKKKKASADKKKRRKYKPSQEGQKAMSEGTDGSADDDNRSTPTLDHRLGHGIEPSDGGNGSSAILPKVTIGELEEEDSETETRS